MTMFYNKVEICGVNTSELEVLDDDEKRSLLEKIKRGDTKARTDLIYGNLRLVLSVIKRFGGKRDNADDLFQVGCLGLVKAVDNFNTDLEVKFSTYAVPMIIGEIRRYLRDNNAIRISRSLRDLAYRALQVKEQIQSKKTSEPSIDEIAKALDTTKENVARAMEAIVEPISIYEPVYNDGGDSLYVIDQLSDNTGSDEGWLENIALRDAMQRLNEREKAIISMRYFKNRTQTEIAAIIGISQAQVSRLEKAALEKMRKCMV
jgi:RNA polymerase sporulation-specific sigma factor